MSLRQLLSDAVERIVDAISRFVAPAMPWLFLALRRALIATLAAVIVAVLFFLVPQSREVLSGLGEPPLKSLKDFNVDTANLINRGPTCSTCSRRWRSGSPRGTRRGCCRLSRRSSQRRARWPTAPVPPVCKGRRRGCRAAWARSCSPRRSAR